MAQIKDWFVGKASKEVYTKTLVVVLIITICTFLFSILFYHKDNFSFLSTQVSSLGSFKPERVGSYFFTIGFVLMGVLMLPHGLFLFRTIKDDLGVYGKISFVFLMMACVGIVFVGLIPTNISYTIHVIAAGMAFGGIAFGMILIMPPLKNRVKRGAEWPTWPLIIVLFFPLLIIAVLSITLIGIPAFDGVFKGVGFTEPDFWPLFEWLLVFTSMYWFFGIVFTCKPD